MGWEKTWDSLPSFPVPVSIPESLTPPHPSPVVLVAVLVCWDSEQREPSTCGHSAWSPVPLLISVSGWETRPYVPEATRCWGWNQGRREAGVGTGAELSPLTAFACPHRLQGQQMGTACAEAGTRGGPPLPLPA